MARLTRRQVVIMALVLVLFASAGSWLFLTLRSQEKQPNGATIVKFIYGVEEVHHVSCCQGFGVSRRIT